MKKFTACLIITLATLSIITPSSVFANDFEKGKEKAAMCATCHGIDGVSLAALWPNLAGQRKDYMIKQLNDFQTGKRQDPLMSPMAKALTPDDIKNLATYYSSLEKKTIVIKESSKTNKNTSYKF